MLHLSRKMDTSNRKMKELLEKYRHPSKLCLDIILVIIFLILLGILYKVLTKE